MLFLVHNTIKDTLVLAWNSVPKNINKKGVSVLLLLPWQNFWKSVECNMWSTFFSHPQTSDGFGSGLAPTRPALSQPGSSLPYTLYILVPCSVIYSTNYSPFWHITWHPFFTKYATYVTGCLQFVWDMVPYFRSGWV